MDLQSPLPFPETILYGAAYYHEYMPRERLSEDLRLMHEAGFSVIRVGESTWTDWEPADGDFHSDWMCRILDQAHALGIKVILGLPTYSIPPWLYRKHPDIVITRQGGTRAPIGPEAMPTYPQHVAPGAYGPRQNQDYTHPLFLHYAHRVTEKILDAFVEHPAIIGYQIDNETMPNPVQTAHSRKAFLEYLKSVYGSPKEFNERFVLSFWGQCISEWEEFPGVQGIVNPGLRLAWARFQSLIVQRYLKSLVDQVRERKRADQFITHDFIGGPQPALDQWEIARSLDQVAANIYYPTQSRMSAAPIFLAGDFARSLKQTNHLITETNAQTIGWDSRAQFPHYPGQLKLAALAHLATGANMVAYWHWASCHNGIETYWRGILGHDLAPGRVYREACEIGALLRRIGPILVHQRVPAKVAIVYSAEACRALGHMPFDDHYNYGGIVAELYTSLLDAGWPVHFVSVAEPDRWQSYRVLLVPPLYVASDETLEALADFVDKGGHALVMFKAGYANLDATVRSELAPGPLSKAAGFTYQEFTNLRAPQPLRTTHRSLRGAQASVWAEFLDVSGAEVLASLDDPFFPHPVITRNQYGKGFLTYQGTVLDQKGQRDLIRETLENAGLAPPLSGTYPPEVVYRRNIDRADFVLHYFLNFCGAEQSFSYGGESGYELLSQRPFASGEMLTLAPWSGVIIRENKSQKAVL
jgi:beta-galactosidase